MTKIEKAQESCEQVQNGIEDGTITTTADLVLNGNPEIYLKTGTECKPLD